MGLVFIGMIFWANGCSSESILSEETSVTNSDITVQLDDGQKEAQENVQYTFEEIPDEYFKKATQQGTLERFDYSVIDVEGTNVDKYALVYLPSGYDKDEYYIYFSIGDQDMAYDAVVSLSEGLKEYPSTFVFTDDFRNGNIHVDQVKGFDQGM